MSYLNLKPAFYTTVIAALVTMAACNGSANKDAALRAQQHTIDSMNAELAKKRVIDSMNEASRTTVVFPGNDRPVTAQPVVSSSAATTTRSTSVSHSSRRGYSGYRHHTSYSNTVAEAPARHKRGWSAKAKGAVIGAGTGAAVGAIVNKRNRGAGAIIGTVIGAGAGTGVGAIIDKKKGR